MSFIDLLKKNEKLVLWNRFRINRNKPDFREFVLNGYLNPEYVNIENYGEEYPGMTFYVADEQGYGVGFFAELGVTLIKLYYADHHGFTPFITWGENYLYWEKSGIDGEENAFRYFFEQIDGIDSIKDAAHVIRSQYTHYEWVKKRFDAVSYDVSEEYVNAMTDMMKKYIRYNQKTEDYLKKEYTDLLGDKKTIAVHYRGTDFKRNYNNHPIMVRIEQEIEEVKKLLDTKDYEQIFLATDDESAIRAFEKEFGDRLKYYKDTFRDDGGDESIAFSDDKREHHKYHLALEVLRDQYTLTNCAALICGYSNVTFLARIMRKAWHEDYFKDYILINNGINHNTKSFGESGHGNNNK